MCCSTVMTASRHHKSGTPAPVSTAPHNRPVLSARQSFSAPALSACCRHQDPSEGAGPAPDQQVRPEAAAVASAPARQARFVPVPAERKEARRSAVLPCLRRMECPCDPTGGLEHVRARHRQWHRQRGSRWAPRCPSPAQPPPPCLRPARAARRCRARARPACGRAHFKALYQLLDRIHASVESHSPLLHGFRTVPKAPPPHLASNSAAASSSPQTPNKMPIDGGDTAWMLVATGMLDRP